jgi:hypothetical protein
MGCPVKVGTLGINPVVIITENYTHVDGNAAYKLTGLSIDILKLVCEKMNLTIIFLAPSLNLEFYSYGKQFAELDEGLSDIFAGFLPLSPVVVTSSFDPTILYMYGYLKMLVPCPKAIPGTEKVLKTFSLSVWLTTGLVLLLTTAVFWCSGNGPYRSVCNETHKYQSLSNCFQNTWSVFVGVSVPQQPTTSRLRILYFLYVCFCFAISTVFQAFFVSYLVEPMYEKKIRTFDELLSSDVVYRYQPAFAYTQYSLAYPDFVKFAENKDLKEDCGDIRKCVYRMITKRDISTVAVPMFATYVAKEMGVVDVEKIICSFDDVLMSSGLITLFKKGNPLLDRFNILMRRYLEAGLMERTWTELHHQAALTGGGRFTEAAGVEFFPFSLSHLMPAFVVLLVGTVLSSAVFIGELIVNCLWKLKGKIEFIF